MSWWRRRPQPAPLVPGAMLVVTDLHTDFTPGGPKAAPGTSAAVVRTLARDGFLAHVEALGVTVHRRPILVP